MSGSASPVSIGCPPRVDYCIVRGDVLPFHFELEDRNGEPIEHISFAEISVAYKGGTWSINSNSQQMSISGHVIKTEVPAAETVGWPTMTLARFQFRVIEPNAPSPETWLRGTIKVLPSPIELAA